MTFIDLCMAGDSTISERLNLIRRQQEAVHAQMTQLQSTLDMLDYKGNTAQMSWCGGE